VLEPSNIKIPDDSKTDNRHLLYWLSIAGFIISVLSLIVNYFVQPEIELQIITFSGIILFPILAIIIKRKHRLILCQYLMIIIALVYENLLWYYGHGYSGYILYLFVFIFAVTIFIWEGKKLIISTIIILANLSICFYIEYNYPEAITEYADKQSGLLNAYSSILMFFILIYALMRTVKKGYSIEYRKALQSDKLKTSFLENINHEVRTPLNAIIGFSSLLKEDDITPEQKKEYIEMVGESNDALLRIIDDILLVSTLESGNARTNMGHCNLDNMITGLFKTFKQHLIKNKKDQIELVVSQPNISGIVETDKIRLQQVFIRLFDNAIKFTDKGKINFGYRVEKDTILFHIADTGIGIEKKHHSKIFERFYKVEIDKDEVYRGTGIGLYITKKIVESLDGEIWLSSIFGSGTTFYFTIPIKEFQKI